LADLPAQRMLTRPKLPQNLPGILELTALRRPQFIPYLFTVVLMIRGFWSVQAYRKILQLIFGRPKELMTGKL
jgi:hypothetical protein